jgi:hypothetical protein
MGFLTTLTISNDGLHTIVEDPKGFCDKLYALAAGGKSGYIDGSMGYSRFAAVQKPLHADMRTIYVQHGGAVYEMDTWSSQARKMLEENPKYFNEILKYMSENLRELQQMYTAANPAKKSKKK